MRVMVVVACLSAVVVVLISLAILRRERYRYRWLQERFSRMLITADQAGDLVTIMNRKGRIEYVNRALEIASGYAKRELVGRKNRHGFPWYGDQLVFDEMRRTVLAGFPFRGTVSCRRKDGTPFLLLEHVAPLRERNGHVTRLVSTARDVSRQKLVEERLDYLDNYDPLTGIPNRRHFAQLLKQELGDKRPVDWLLSVMILDIDRFKYINDLFGSEVGDDALRRIADIIRSVLGEQDIVARLGSDEFGVIHRYNATFIDTGAVAERIRTAVSQKIAVGGQDIVATVTIGIASFPDSGRDARTLLRNADMALSRAKAQGRNSVQFYSREMNERISQFYAMEKRLIGALRNSEYRVNYQPYCDLITKRVSGAEALIRWHNSELGFVAPSTFIPALEESGLIVDVGEWVLQTACRQIRELDRMNRSLSIAVNLSQAQFRHRNLVAMVADTIKGTNIDPRFLTLELTESICIQDIDFAITVLKKLKDAGVSISIDDFGTGYSSLSYIKRLPVDTLKIDMSFIHDVSRDPDAASIITAITGMARSLKLKTIAEGVESEDQRNILHLLRCDMGQGHYFSPAVGAEEFEKMIA
jgi:diguanylate cyclase (GGDEF)-like protein/PAS domain S-box-containing protein